MYVSLMLDAEDFIGSKEPDAVRDVAKLLTSFGLRATFCVVGELARRLDREKRFDVLSTLESHDIGLHTDLHSVHPTTCEALEGLDWDEGVAAMIEQNRPGVEAIRRIFGRNPSCWGGAGNTWGPQVVGALKELGVPAFVYAHTAPPGNDAHEYDGLLAYGCGLHLGDWALENEHQSRVQRDKLLDGLADKQAAGQLWCEVFVAHPCVLRTSEFWDAINFTSGRNPPSSDWRPAQLRPEEEYRRALRNLEKCLEALAIAPDIRFATIHQMNEWCETASRTLLSSVELANLRVTVESRLNGMRLWPIHRPDLDVTRITELTVERLCTVRGLKAPAGPPT